MTAITDGIVWAFVYICFGYAAVQLLWIVGVLVCSAFSRPNRLVRVGNRLIITDRVVRQCTGKYRCPCDKCRELRVNP